MPSSELHCICQEYLHAQAYFNMELSLSCYSRTASPPDTHHRNLLTSFTAGVPATKKTMDLHVFGCLGRPEERHMLGLAPDGTRDDRPITVL